MLRALYTSATGMKAQELLIDNTANNIANVNTNGFRRSRMDFADLVYTNYLRPGANISAGQVSPTGMQIGNGVRPIGTTKHFAQGSMEQTGNPLDVAIEGDGFFQVIIPNGETRYTRAGNFRIDADGNLVNSDGFLLTPNLTIPAGTDLTRITIGGDGTIQASQVGTDASPQTLGQIQIATFLNPAGLSSEGSNLFSQTPASGQPVIGFGGQAGFGVLRQSFLEGSNVEVVTELISLISAQRAYEVNSRAIRAGDEMLSTSVDIVR
ncbi:MAG: flagellar basal-body rod protein FlgG [Planctomycetaceae bacterium]|nr:flagellar basal-body rod protein FlgG [Planctomycetaceae bacterium]